MMCEATWCVKRRSIMQFLEAYFFINQSEMTTLTIDDSFVEKMQLSLVSVQQNNSLVSGHFR